MQLLLSLDQVPLLLDEVLLDYFSNGVQLTERLMLGHVILQVATQVDLEQITEIRNVIARPRAHF